MSVCGAYLFMFYYTLLFMLYYLLYSIHVLLSTLLYSCSTIYSTLFMFYYLLYSIHALLSTLLYSCSTIYSTLFMLYYLLYSIHVLLSTLLYSCSTIYSTLFMFYYLLYSIHALLSKVCAHLQTIADANVKKKFKASQYLSSTQLQFSRTTAIIIKSLVCVRVLCVRWRWCTVMAVMQCDSLCWSGDRFGSRVTRTWNGADRDCPTEHMHTHTQTHILDALTPHIGHRHVQMYQCVRSQGGPCKL